MGCIDALLEVTEPLGMETLVFFRINGVDVCAPVSPMPARAKACACGSPPAWTTCT